MSAELRSLPALERDRRSASIDDLRRVVRGRDTYR